MKRFKVGLIVTLLAALVGVIAGRYYATALTGVAQADNPNIDPPTWKDLQVLYLGPSGAAVKHAEFDPANFAGKVNAQIVTNADAVVKHSQTQGLDIFVFDQSALSTIDPVWASAQFKQGTAFIGLNVTAQELGTLVDDSDLAQTFGATVNPEPFVSYVVVRISGNPEHIQLLKEEQALYPPDEKKQGELGIHDVGVFFSRGSASLPPAGLADMLDTLRLNLAGQGLVRP